MPEKIPTNRPDPSMASKAWSIGIALVLLTLVGHWLDTKFNTTVLFTLVGAALGIAYSLYEAGRLLNGD